MKFSINNHKYWITILLLTMMTLFYGENLIQNPGFEQGKSFPQSWSRHLWKDDPSYTQVILDDYDCHSGKKCIMINNLQKNDARIGQIIKVQAKKKYIITCWAKTENISTDALGANISVSGQLVTSLSLQGTHNDWQKLTLYISVDQGVDQILITVGLGGYSSMNTGKAWFDDLEMKPIKSIPMNSRTIFLAKTKTKATGKTKVQLFSPPFINTYIITFLTLFFMIIGIIYFLKREKSDINPVEQQESPQMDSDNPGQIDSDNPGQIDSDNPEQIDSDNPEQIDSDNPEQMDSDNLKKNRQDDSNI